MKIKLLIIVISITALIDCGKIYANGRSVGISENDILSYAIISCKCIDKSANEYHLSRIKISEGRADQPNLIAKTGVALIKLPLTRLDYIKFSDNTNDDHNDAYLKAKVKFKQNEDEKVYDVFVGSNDEPLYINGLNEDFVYFSIKLKDCNRLYFESNKFDGSISHDPIDKSLGEED